ncbi:MAG: radical SAM protein, partial [Defluviitaleaceae bacterium]|nr:radical SAM protein [Defluviitaleaceae bacterium]
QAQNFDDAGYKEIVVAGIHVASYGKDLKGKNLLDVLGDIAALPNIQRVRLSSVEPNIITNEFCEFVAQTPKFCDHLHLSLQSGSNEILRFMNRKYTTDDFARAVEMLRQTSPDISITTDIIAGFPGEIEEHHAQTIAFLQEIQLAKLHVFPYSPKKGTAAAKMQGQITKAVKTARAKSLIELGKELEQAYAQKFLGKTMDILIEENRPEGVCVGKTRNYLTVHCTSKAPQLPNTIVAAHISKVHNGVAYGHVK